MENVVRNQLRSLIVLLSLPIATDDVIYVDLSLKSVIPPPLLTVSQCVSTTTSKLVEPFLGDSFHLRMAEQWFSAESLFPQLHTFANSGNPLLWLLSLICAFRGWILGFFEDRVVVFPWSHDARAEALYWINMFMRSRLASPFVTSLFMLHVDYI